MLLEHCIKEKDVIEGHTPAPDIVYRAAARGVIGSINFALTVMAQQDVRARNTVTEAGANIDAYNAIYSKQEDESVEEQMQEEQGGSKKMPNAERGALLRGISLVLNADLESYADRIKVDHPRIPGKTMIIAEPMHVGEPLSVALERQIERQPRPSDAAMKARARALGVTEEEMIESERRAAAYQANFIKNNKATILETAMNYTFENAYKKDKLSPAEWKAKIEAMYKLDLDTLFGKLPIIDQMRLLVAADNGLYFRRTSDAQAFVRDSRREDLMSNVGAYDAARIVLHKRIDEFVKDANVKRALIEARDRGERLPALKSLIVPIKEEAPAAKKTA